MTKKTLAEKFKGVMTIGKLYLDLMTNPTQEDPVKIGDSGIREYPIDKKTGEVIKIVEREANSDTTVILKKLPNEILPSGIYGLAKTINYKGKVYEITQNASGVWESKPKIIL